MKESHRTTHLNIFVDMSTNNDDDCAFDHSYHEKII